MTEGPIGPVRQEELPRSSDCSTKPISRKTGSRATSSPTLVARLEGRVVGSAGLEH
ncbi:MAG TPA: hypothetical protein VK276_01295 [Rubrobacteraceae bacterium]|nr:hypothetical protein [Rubrobacteraceae bacterium]